MNTTTTQCQDFRKHLQEELVKRCRNNPNYSLRSFAKNLNISPSALTEMLSGKRTITNRSIEKLGLTLGLRISEINSYISASQTKSADSTNEQINFQQLTIDQYSLISDWYHYAILELLKVKDFRPDNHWIAKSLDISKSEANIAIERLVRLNLIEVDEQGNLKDISDGFTTNISGNLTSHASKQLQKQILEQSIYALENSPIESRNHTSMTMAIDPALIPETIKKITKFRRELCEYLESQGEPMEVYQLSVSLFPITKINESNSTGELK